MFLPFYVLEIHRIGRFYVKVKLYLAFVPFEQRIAFQMRGHLL